MKNRLFTDRRYTILIVTFETIARVDCVVDDAITVVQSWQRPRPEQADLGEAARIALDLAAASRGRLVVLSDEIWSGTVTLDQTVIAAVPNEQLDQTIALEAETLSGYSAFDSRIASVVHATNAHETTWDVVQIETLQVNQIATLLASTGHRLEAIGATTMIDSGGTVAPGSSDAEPISDLAAFARDWLAAYLQDDHAFPVIVMDQAAGDAPRKWLALGVCCAVALAAIFLHLHGRNQVADATTQLQQLQTQEVTLRREIEQAEQLARRQKEVAEQQANQADAAAERRRKLYHARAEWIAQRARPAALLRALATTASEGHWIQKIELGRQRTIIGGVAVDNLAVAQLTRNLQAELDAARWIIEPAKLSLSDATRLVVFEVVLRTKAVETAPLTVAQTAGGHDVQ